MLPPKQSYISFSFYPNYMESYIDTQTLSVVCLSVQLFVHRCLCLSSCLYVHQSFLSSVHLLSCAPIFRSVRLSIHLLSVYLLFICPEVNITFYSYVCSSIQYLSICLLQSIHPYISYSFQL